MSHRLPLIYLFLKKFTFEVIWSMCLSFVNNFFLFFVTKHLLITNLKHITPDIRNPKVVPVPKTWILKHKLKISFSPGLPAPKSNIQFK